MPLIWLWQPFRSPCCVVRFKVSAGQAVLREGEEPTNTKGEGRAGV